MEGTRSTYDGGDQIWSQSLVSYYCECTEPRVFRLTFRGGSSGNFELECCQKCYDEDDKQFMIKEERILGEERCDQT